MLECQAVEPTDLTTALLLRSFLGNQNKFLNIKKKKSTLVYSSQSTMDKPLSPQTKELEL